MRRQTIDDVTIESDNKIMAGPRIHGRGTVTRTFLKERPTKSQCVGCEDDFYNGHNPMGVTECWAFKSASVVNKVGYSSIHVMNGPDTRMIGTLSCWHAVCK